MLFRLRADVDILSGPDEDDGSPTGILFDRLSGTYHRLEWPALEIVSRLRGATDPEVLAASLRKETALEIDQRQVDDFLLFMHHAGLLVTSAFLPADQLESMAASSSIRLHSRLLRQYLFFKVPLIRPDAFLKRTLWIPALFGSRLFSVLLAVVAVTAVALALPRLDLIRQDALPFVSWSGGLLLGAAMVAVKVCHEFAHAYAAAARGVSVSSMGVAFMVLAPIPYSDVSDAWRLDRRRRLAVSFAGVRVELAIAAFALLLWTALPPGPARDICLMLCGASLLSTLLTNLNPGMRFDGYYLLSDILGVDNLQQRAFTHTRRFYRRLFLGLGDGKNHEPRLGVTKRAGLIVYTVYAVLYRLGLYFGIALMVYMYFPKILGIFLFAVEIYAFILAPAAREVGEVAAMAWRKGVTVRMVLALLAFGGLAWWFAAPLPRRIRLEAVTARGGETVVYSPAAGTVRAFPLVRDGEVAKGQVILELEDPDLERVIRQSELEYRSLVLAEKEAVATGDKASLRPLAADEDRTLSVLASYRARTAQNILTAEEDGVVLEVAEGMAPGTPIGGKTLLAKIAPRNASLSVVAYLPEGRANELTAGDTAWFVPDSRPGERFELRVEAVAGASVRRVEERSLTAPHGGRIPVVPDSEGGMVPAEPLYRVEAVFVGETPDVRQGQLGRLTAVGPPRSLLVLTWNRLLQIVLRESGF